MANVLLLANVRRRTRNLAQACPSVSGETWSIWQLEPWVWSQPREPAAK